MMSTYELVVAFFSTNSNISTSEITTVQKKIVVLNNVDSEANATSDSEL